MQCVWSGKVLQHQSGLYKGLKLLVIPLELKVTIRQLFILQQWRINIAR